MLLCRRGLFQNVDQLSTAIVRIQCVLFHTYAMIKKNTMQMRVTSRSNEIAGTTAGIA